MSLAPLQGMDGNAVKIGFGEALGELQALLHRPVRVYVDARATLSGCVIEGPLDRIESLPPDDQAVEVVIGAQSLLLDPVDVSVLVAGNPGRGGAIEFHLRDLAIRLEAVAQ